MNKLLVILGPTATGKTDLALLLAKKFNGELVSCDSRQVYEGLDIGTGKYPSKNSKFEIRNSKLIKQHGQWTVNGVNIWMYDVVSPKIQYSVADYVRDANKVIKGIEGRGKLPIVVGGTGLYLKALIDGLPNLAIPLNKNLRKKLQKLSKEDLQEKLKKLSPERWGTLNESDRENSRRLVRAIELKMSSLRMQGSKKQTAYWIPAYAGMTGLNAQCFNVLKIGLIAPRAFLYKRVDEKVVSRIRQGMIEEAKSLQKKGLTLKRMRQLGLEYGVLADYLAGKIQSKEELIKLMQNKIHGFIRRQLTWFKKEEQVSWFDIRTFDYQGRIEKLVTDWYNHN